MERTLSIVKPDAVGSGHLGAILEQIERSGLAIVALRMLRLTKERAEAFYAVHSERPFFSSLVEFVSSGPIVVSVLQGERAIDRYRELMGTTDPGDADEGTIRRRFATNVERNAVHGSDGPDTARDEIAFFFDEDDITRR